MERNYQIAGLHVSMNTFGRTACLALPYQVDSDAVPDMVINTGLRLADPVSPVCGLFLYGEIPPGIKMDHRICTDKVEACAAGFDRYEHDLDPAFCVEFFSHLHTK